VLLIGLPEFFRELQQYRMLAFGAAMVAIMVWRPRGLLAHREPTIRLSGRSPPAPQDGASEAERAGV
jgi:branched-chain amino acid transport system permease protein